MRLIPPCHDAGIFIRADAKAIADTLYKWSCDNEPFLPPERHQCSYGTMWELLEPRTCPITHGILVGVGEGWTAFFDNHRMEWLYDAIAYNATRLMRVESYAFDYDGDPESEYEGSGTFRAYFPEGNTEVRTRHVQLLKDPRWKLTQAGDPLPFEDLDAYQNKRSKERLTLEMLKSYASHLRIPLDDPSAYSSEVFLLRDSQAPPPDPKTAFEKLNKIFGGRLRWLGGGNQ